MISKNTNIKLSDKQVATLEANAVSRGMDNPTTPGIIYAIIADLPEFGGVATVAIKTESNEELFNENADQSKHFKS